jgi:hypothetical protein
MVILLVFWLFDLFKAESVPGAENIANTLTLDVFYD